MKILVNLLMFIVVSLGENIYALTFEDQFHERLMEVGWKKSLLELNRYSSNEQRYILGRALQAFASDQIPRDPSRQESLELAQSVLLATPGHAKYYQDKIESLREIARANAKTPEEMANNMGNYNDFRKGAFKVLGLLPSSEAIAVLGHFLNDPEGKDGKDLLGYPMRVSEVVPYPPNFGAAWIALSNIGIANPPAVGKNPERDTFFYDLSEVDAWKSWWNEIKDGKRTYRFIGSNIQYGSDGPASKEVIERAERHQRRDNERAMGHKKSSARSGLETAITQIQNPSSIAWLVAAIGLIGVVVWYFLKGRKTA